MKTRRRNQRGGNSKGGGITEWLSEKATTLKHALAPPDPNQVKEVDSNTPTTSLRSYIFGNAGDEVDQVKATVESKLSKISKEIESLQKERGELDNNNLNKIQELEKKIAIKQSVKQRLSDLSGLASEPVEETRVATDFGANGVPDSTGAPNLNAPELNAPDLSTTPVQTDPAPGDSLAPAPGDSLAPAPGDSLAPAPGDSLEPAPGDSLAPERELSESSARFTAPESSGLPGPGGGRRTKRRARRRSNRPRRRYGYSRRSSRRRRSRR
jgi:hypothetical protein